MTDNMKSCFCDGSNENCRYRFGTGVRPVILARPSRYRPPNKSKPPPKVTNEARRATLRRTSTSPPARLPQISNLSPKLSRIEEQLLARHLKFYTDLFTGKRSPQTVAQKHFVEVVRGRAKPESEHEVAYLKHLKILQLKRSGNRK